MTGTFFVAGAGIGGLTLALALAKFGATVVVLEQNPTISEFGAGLQISPNARKIIDNLGLSEALAARTLEPSGIDLYPYRSRRPLLTMELGDIMRQSFGAPYAVMHRADLADTLYKACRRFANIDIVFGVRAWDVVSHARGVTVSIDEANGQSRTSRGKAFIGADGVHSQTRIRLLEGPAAHYGNRVAWRTLVPFHAVAGHLKLDRVSVLFGRGYHIVCYPLPHRQQVNLALFAKANQPRQALGDRPNLGRQDARINALLAAAGTNWTAWPLYTVSTPNWHLGNIGLLGDAAHAMVPFQAQGAAMAIEDAAVLAPLLVAEPLAETAFANYAAQRQDRVTRVARVSQTNGRIFHMPWPLSAGRDLAIRLQGRRGHIARLAWLYGHEMTQGVSAAAPKRQNQP